MAFIKKYTTEFGMDYEYWCIDSFNIYYKNDKGIVDVVFSGYLNKESKDSGALFYTQKTQQIPFEVFLVGFKNMTGFADVDIKNALYSLKDYYTEFKDAEDVM